MASFKCKGFLRRKSNSELIRCLRKQNALLKILVQFSRQHSEDNQLLERFLTVGTALMEKCQQLMANDNKTDVLSEQLSEKEGNEMDAVSMRRESTVSSYSRETEEMKNEYVRLSTRCQYLENKVAQKKDSTTDEWASPNTTIDLQSCLRDALEKNKQWLEYDQQREAYVRAILARMLWLEKQLNEANQARSQQHNEDHSDEKEQIRQMQKYYESLLQRAKDQLDVLRKELDMAQHNLIMTQSWCKERESEVDELKQQLQTENMNRESAQEDHHYSEDEEHWLTAVTEDLQYRLDEEERESASSELQSTPFEKFLLDRHRADQERIADLERQIKISSQDLEDEKQDCLYLQKQMVRILKTLKPKDHVTKQSKRDRQDCTSCEEAYPPSLRSRDSITSSTHSSSLNESFLECPGCRSQYPASHHRELMTHLEVCLD
ncbi:hypothetical protein ABVT39_018984 [Epinephelus coioides]